MEKKESDSKEKGTIKDDIIIIFKESMKFALVSVIVFLLIGISLLYILLEILGVDAELASILVGIIAVIWIVVIDDKKFYRFDKITESNRRIAERITNRIIGKF